MSALIPRRAISRSLSLVALSSLALALPAPAAITPIPVANAGFEAPESSAFSAAPGAIAGWTFTAGTNGAAGVQVGENVGQIPDPNHAGYLWQGIVGNPDILEQTLTGKRLVALAIYTLTMDVGRRDGQFDLLTVNLFAGATPLAWTATGANPVPGADSNVPWSFTYEAPAVPALGDLKLQFVAGVLNGDMTSLDNIVLTQEVVPEPATLSVLGLAAGLILARRRRA